MSAYVCTNKTIAALALFASAIAHGYGGIRVDPRYVDDSIADTDRDDLPMLYAKLLFEENAKSVAYRYREEPETYDVAEMAKAIRDYRTEQAVKGYLTPVEILKICNCVEYQSCEHPEWRESIACRLLQKVRDAAVRELPGYDDAPWGLR